MQSIEQLTKVGPKAIREDKVGEANKLSTAERAKAKRLATVFKMTLGDHNAKRTEQHNACAICSRPFSEFQAYQDHDHKCCCPPRGKKARTATFCGLCNRGLLCYLCNRYAVGLFEWMRKMNIPPQKVVDYFLGWDEIITAKGGYASKEKTSTQGIPKKQSRVRRSSKTRPTVGTPVVES